jgi:hypothetical protein
MVGEEFKKGRRYNRHFAFREFSESASITDFHSTGIRMTARCPVY